MAAWDNPSVASPGAPNYAAPLLDFSPIGNLPNDFYKGQQNRLDYDKARAFQQGLPRDATGNLDFSAIADTLARHGDISQVVPLSNTELDRRLIDTALRDGGLGVPGQGDGLPAQGLPAPSAAPQAPQGGPQPAPRMLTPAPAGGVPQRAEIPPNGIPRADNGKRSIPGGDDGETSLMSIVANKIGDDAAAGPIALKLAQALKLDPNASNDPTKAANLAKYVDGYLKKNPPAAAAPGQQPAAALPAGEPAAAPAAPTQGVEPRGAGASDPVAALLPPGVTDARAYAAALRKSAAALALSPRTAAIAKQREDQAKAIETALQPTGGQKEAYASGGLNPLQFENAKIVAKVAAENNARTPEQKLYAQAVDQGFKGTELDFQAERERLKGGTFKVIGKDQNGNDVHGFIDPANRKAFDINGNPIDTSKLAGFTDAGNAHLSGDAFLQTLDAGRANQVKAITEGRMAPPGGMSLKSPQIQSLMRDVAQYEPGFDLTSWTARNKTRADLASGKMGQNVSSFNTAIGHLETLDKAAEALNNYNFTPFNSVANLIKSKTGDPAIKNFEIARTAVADELTRAFRGSGGNVHDLVQWESAINAANSPAQLKAAVKQAVDLLHSRIEAVGDQYNRGMGKTTDPLELLSPKAKASILKLEGKPDQADAKPTVDKAAIARAQADPQATLAEARAAIAAGKSRDGVIEKLRVYGVDPSGL